MTSEVDHLVAMARSLGAPVAAIELASDFEEGDNLTIRWERQMRAVLARPGPDDSRYWSRLLAVPTADAEGLARAAADALGVELAIGGVDELDRSIGARWIQRQGPPPAVPYDVHWELTWWTDAGTRIDAAGVTAVPARSGGAACRSREHALEAAHAGRPLRVRCSIPEIHAGWWRSQTPRPHPGVPARGVVRGWHRDGASAADVAMCLRDSASTVTPLVLMLAFESAFHLELDELAPLAAWAAGHIDDPALDAALAPTIAARRPSWDRPHRLRQAHAGGASLGAPLRADHAAGAIQLMLDLREAFGVSLRYAKEAVAILGAVPDAEVDRVLAAAIAGTPVR